MTPRRIAIACQGGGSQCAFVAGALKTLLSRGVQHRFKIVGLSGTSGGAITAALAWVGLLEQARGKATPVEERMIAWWRDISAQTPQEILLDTSCTQLLRLVEQGMLPSIETSPSSPRFQMWAQAMARLIARPEFTDLRAGIVKHLDFGALPSLVDAESPVLLVGAGDVREGSIKIFSSARGEISADALLASAAIPNLFPAAVVDGHAYWDGIFASNPPVVGFLRESLVGKDKFPQEIWIVQVNRSHHDDVPETPSDILDRRNHLAGNLSLRHELQLIDMVNLLLQEGALTPQFRARFGLNTSEPITVRFIRMSKELQEGLDYPSKLSRRPTHIAALLADGESQAGAFLAQLWEADRSPDHPGGNGGVNYAEQLQAETTA